ncbi:hypothetical protein ACFL4T_06780 [candidate division KSB1 bacterium]
MKEFFDAYKELILMFIIYNGAIILGGWIFVGLLQKRSRLKKKGYSDEYIDLSKNISDEVGPKVVSLLILSQILVGVVIYLIFGEITRELYTKYIIFISVLIAMPFGALFSNIKSDKFKELAFKTKSDIIIDFNYRNLNLLFNKTVEIPVFLIALAYAVLHLDFSVAGAVLIYLLLPWFFSIAVRRTKNLNKPVFQNTYLLVGKLNVIYQSVLVFLIVIGSIKHFEGFLWYNYVFFFAAECVLIFKVIFYASNYPKLKKELHSIEDNTANAVNA